MNEAAEQSSNRTGGSLTARAYALFAVATALGLAHHVDHVVRGNHVGWPITPSVNPFTYSLAIYPLVALGIALSRTDRAGARYWTTVLSIAGRMLALVHLGPWAVEPPRDVIRYADPLWGYVAFAILVGLIVAACLGRATRRRSGSERRDSRPHRTELPALAA